MPIFGWKMKVFITVSLTYMNIANYCKFKEALGYQCRAACTEVAR